MTRFVIFIFTIFSSTSLYAQSLQDKLNIAVKQLRDDPQLKHALLGFYVVETATGAPVFAVNEETGMSPASTQKIITAATAFQLLGSDFRYQTKFYAGAQPGTDSIVKGSLMIKGSGDPTLGSIRWKQTRDTAVFLQLRKALQKQGIKGFTGTALFDLSAFDTQSIPGGWSIDDIGNYYGAGCYAVNWKENQFDITLRSASAGSLVAVDKVEPYSTAYNFVSEVTAKGSGDNAYIFLPIDYPDVVIRGTIPPAESNFKISAAAVNPYDNIKEELIKKSGLFVAPSATTVSLETQPGKKAKQFKLIHTHYSPSLDSVTYWFLQKSVNLYGEALIKTIAWQRDSLGSTDKGIETLQNFWKQQGIDAYSLNMRDGSGLSPQNKVTSKALVQVLQYAQKQPWFNSFYNALPIYNGMRMKSGTISGVKGFTGYHTAANGKQYTFAIIVNNYDESKGSVANKLFKVLDNLK